MVATHDPGFSNGAALSQPWMQIAQNAGEESAVVVQTLLKQDDLKKGYNA